MHYMVFHEFEDEAFYVPCRIAHGFGRPDGGVLDVCESGKSKRATVFRTHKSARDAIRRTRLYRELFMPNEYPTNKFDTKNMIIMPVDFHVED